MRRLALALLVAASLGGCATLPPDACPAGEAKLRTAQLFFARNAEGGLAVTDAEFRKFITDEIAPRFPQGLSVLDGGAQWRGEANKVLRDSAKWSRSRSPRIWIPRAISRRCAAPTARGFGRRPWRGSPNPPASPSDPRTAKGRRIAPTALALGAHPASS